MSQQFSKLNVLGQSLKMRRNRPGKDETDKGDSSKVHIIYYCVHISFEVQTQN